MFYKSADLSSSSLISSTLVVIDPNVSDYEMLVSSVVPDVNVVVLKSDRDGVSQITAILQQSPQIKSLHLIAHGAPGVIHIGNQPLSLETLNGYAQALQSWTLESLLIYGCQVATGDAGAEFLHKLHRLTGAAIAASTTKTGNAALGGNWNLEAAIPPVGNCEANGNPPSLLAFDEATQQQYAGVLGLLDADDYAALKALYQSTNGANWTNNTGWKDWDFNSTTPPDTSVMSNWTGILVINGRVGDLNLRQNNLNGTIPTELGNLLASPNILLSGNSLSGVIPTSLGRLTGLRRLELQENQLTGSIASELGNASHLSYLDLSSNRLSGTIPAELGNSQFIGNFYLNNNTLSGDIPQSVLSINSINFPGFVNLDNPPFVTAIANQSATLNQPLTLNVSVSDIDEVSNDSNLTLNVTSSDSTLIQDSDISVTGSGSTRTITLTPTTGRIGTATITMTLQGGSGEQTIKTFNVTVDGTLNADDYAALKALYQGTDGANWIDNAGWKDWDFNSTTPPALSVVSQWKGVSLTGDRVTDLSLGNNNLVGSIPAEIGNLASLTNLNLVNNQLSGSIPSQIGNLINLTDLYLYGNQLSGSIPSQIGNLTRLSTLNLDVNKLSGSIPVELGNLTQLSIFSAYGNQLSGTIPSQIGNLTNLGTLHLNYNQLSGSIPSELGNLPNLNSLDLSGNQLSGDIPQALLTQLGTSISDYSLDNAPFLTAIADQVVPDNSPLTFNLSISDIDQGSNENPNNLTLTVISNNADVISNSGISVSGTGSSRTLTLTPTGTSGTTTITMTLQDNSGELTLKTFDLTVEQTLNGDDYAALKALYQGTDGANWTNNTGWRDWNFNRTIPPALSVVGQWKGVTLTGDRVTKLSLSVNNLKGNIPTELGNLSQLNALDLALNQLSGTIPSELGNLNKLTKLFLNGNQLGGEIPTTLLSKLGNPIIYRNLDNVPYLSSVNDQSIVQDQALTLNLSISDIEVSSNDTNLSLSFSSDNTALIDTSNISITGTGSDRTVTLTPISGKSGSATITMTLQNSSGDQTLKTFVLTVEPTLNRDDYAALKALYQDTDGANWANNTGWRDWDFNSTTPPALSVASQWYGVALAGDRLQTLSLVNNNLSGVLPIELGDLSNLIQLNLPSNHLSGTIPAELGNLNNLAVLDLQSNQLSGTIPAELGNLNNLSRLFLNDNQLSGDIPTSVANKLKHLPPPLGIIEYGLNNVPFVTSIADQSTTLDEPVTLNVSVSDIDTAGNDTNLTLSVTSDNTTLIDSNGISVTGTGSDRTILLIPNSGQLGSATITMTLQDQSGEQTVKTFTLNVEQTLNASDYAVLKVIYESTGGANWTDRTGWKDWDFSRSTPPMLSVVSQWKGVSLTGDRVTTLDLYNNNLSGSIPTELGNLTSLTALRLYDNQLSGSIPSSLGNLSNLMFLNVANNQLSGSVPSELGNLSNLVRLNLFKNQLSGNIPAELGNLNKLSLFNLSYNQLSGSIPSELSNLTSLTQFYLNDNQLSGTAPQALVNKLSSLTGYDLNNVPYVTPIASQSTTNDNPLTLNLSLSDLDTAGNNDPTLLTLTAGSGNTSLISASGISISGTGSDRVLTLTPTVGQTGTATITLTLQDDSGEKTEKTFTVTVNASTNPTPGTGTTTPTVTPISSITSLFDATKGEFVVSDALLSLNEETLPSGDLFRLRNGTPKADTLRGTGVKEAMFGKANNDQIKGQGGHDCLSGGKGNDTVNGDAGNDLIFGDAGSDTLVGGVGNDVLLGGSGSDRLTTGTGNDKVGFATVGTAKTADTLTDFAVKTDVIVVSAQGFGGGLVAGQSLSAEQFHTGTKAVGVEDRFIYNRNTGNLSFDADGSAAGKAIVFAHLKAGLQLTSQNITVV